jgi:putative (di)nucleoside polyphosphate hydrolase
MQKNKTLPLRTGVGIAVLNNESKVFVGKRKDNPSDKWQMPQGGVDLGENLISAMKRELFEETGISNFSFIKELDYWMEYELPENLVGIIWKGKYRGQKQKWFIVKYLGNDNEINIEGKEQEFIEWKWLNIDELPNVIVDFKKHIYQKLKLELKKFID